MSAHRRVALGLEAYDRRDWATAADELFAADRENEIGVEDLERLATAAYLAGLTEVSADAWARAHTKRKQRDQPDAAAWCAFWLGFGQMRIGQRARANGWFARADRALENTVEPCVEQGYVLLPKALNLVMRGDPKSSLELFEQMAAIADRFGDPDLAAMARTGRGRVLIRMGEVDRGIALLDEAMAAVEAGEVSPVVAGDVYCTVIEGCHEIFDVRRAHEWTMALDRWCEDQPGLVMYRGQCLVRRAEIRQLHGSWTEALADANEACEWLTRPPEQPAAGAAYYQKAELHRLRGNFAEADEAYRRAADWGRSPQPGLALLWLAQGKTAAAEAAVRRALAEASSAHVRAALLQAHVEISIASGETSAAARTAEELTAIANDLDAPYLQAAADRALGAILHERGDTDATLNRLLSALRAWTSLSAPYESAKTRVLLAAAYRAAGDFDSANLQLGAARETFEQLEAGPDLHRLDTPTGGQDASSAPRSHDLTSRELEVLRLVAEGMTNRDIATSLSISVRTVERHVSNILDKLGVPSRTAATAHAYRCGIL